MSSLVIVGNIRLLFRKTVAFTKSHIYIKDSNVTINLLMSWHFYTPWIGWCHEISIHLNCLMPWHFYPSCIGWCHDISIHHKLVDAMIFLSIMNWLMPWHSYSPWLVDAMTFLYLKLLADTSLRNEISGFPIDISDCERCHIC